MQVQRRLVAIMAADVVGYSRLMEAHEVDTYARLKFLRTEFIDPQIAAHSGRIIKHTGDGFLAIFDSALDATECAISVQKTVTAQTAEQPADQRISFRVALNAADIIVENDDIYGDGVNIAARLQAYAPAGGTVVSGAIAEQMGDHPEIKTIDLGDLHLRNIHRPVRVFELRLPTAPAKLIGDSPAWKEVRPSIAVLPFRMHLSDPDEVYFTDGIIDEIIQGLATLKELFVVSRGSTLGYGGATIDVGAIGRELGVRYILYGSVRRSGDRVRIGTELSDAESGTIVRADHYDGTLTDIFALQDRIALSVVKTIAPHVQGRELKRTLRKHPENLTAYDLVLQALDLLYRMDYESFSRARGLLQQALAHDPNYLPAHSYTALWYIFRVGEIGSSDIAADATAGAAHAAAAIERDPYDALSLAIYGHVQSFLLRNYGKAIAYLDRAIEAGPSLAMAWTMSSATCGYVGDGPLAVERGEQGVRLSPQDARTFWHEGLLAQAHYVNGDFEQALEWGRSAVGRNGSIRFNVRTLIATLSALGRKDEAANAARHLLRIQPEFRLETYARACPFQGDALDTWIARLRMAGLPD